MKRFSKIQIILSIFILAALILRIIYLWQFSESPLFNTPIGPDVEEYDNWAREILAWGLNSQRLHIHAPLYPAYLAFLYNIFSFKMLWVRLFQTLLVLGGFGMLSWATQAFVAPKRRFLMWIFLAFAAFYPPLLFYSSELISEVLLLPLLCLTITLLYWSENQIAAGNFRKGAILISAGGVCAGLMAITHPTSLLFIALEIILLFFLALFRKNNKKFIVRLLIPVLFGLMALLVIAPVCVRNSMIAKRFILIQKNSGFNFYLGNNYNATGTCYVRPGKHWSAVHKWADTGAAQRGITKDQFFVYMSLKYIYSNPLEEFKLLVKKAFYVWNFRELTAGADSAPMLYFTSIARSGKYLFILLGSLSICGIILILCKRETIFKYRHFLLLLAAYWAAQTITVTSGRYRLAMYPAFFVFAAFALDYLLQYGKDRKQLLKCGIGLLIGVMIVTIPSPPVNALKEQAETDSLYGEACFKQGKYPEAAKYFQACLKFDPTDVRAYNLLGIITETSSPELAAKYYQQAIQCEPAEADGYLNLAIQYSNKTQYKEAEKYFKKALRYGSDKPGVLYNYACFLQKKGELKLAVEYFDKCLVEAPWHDKALNILGVIYIQSKKPELALKYLRSAHKLNPRKVGFMLNLTVALLQNGKKSEAIKMLKKIINIEPDCKPAKSMLSKFQQ
jgi:tetratricopeptide (TPR) repeat protein